MPERTPPVAVVIICYHGERFLPKSIASVLNQTFTDLELVVVEDGSRDSAEAIVASFNDPRVRYVWRENGGTSAARNTGIANTTAPLVAFLDCDDWWGATKIEAQLETLRRRPDAGVAYSSAVLVTDATGARAVDAADITGDPMRALLERNCVPGSASSVMVRRALLEQVGGFDESMLYAEDWDCWLRLAAVSPFVHSDTPNVFINVRPDSIGRHTDKLRLAAHGLIDRAFQTADPKYRKLKRIAHANIEFGASIDLAHHGRRRKAMVPLLRAIRYDPLRQGFWRRLTLLVLSKFIPSVRRRIVAPT